MNRLLGKKLFSSALAGLTAASLAACGGGGSHSAALPPSSPGSSTASTPYNGPLADATFRISIPGPTNSAFKRRPSYVSSATKSIKFVINSSTTVSGTATTGTLGSYNGLAWHLFNTPTLGTGVCPADGSHPGNFTCTVTIQLPPGTDNMTMSAYDNTNGTGNLLSQQIQDFAVTVGGSAAGANKFSTILDANVNTMTVNGSQPCQNGAVGGVFGSVGTTPVTFTVAYTDLATKTIVAPGLPILQIKNNHAGDTTYHTTTGTIDAGANHVDFSINQSTQTFVLTPSSSNVSNASINMKATPANTNTTSDGLGFSSGKIFTFSTGTAPPTNAFLAAVEQASTSSGQVDFFQIGLGGSGGPDTFTAYATAPTLAVTASNGGTGPNDVDNPESLHWDTNGDLLIGNGDDGGVNHGNMACVPIGAIATGANTSTTVAANVSSPVGMAYDSRDGSVALANEQPGATYNLSQYLLTGNYTAAPPADNIKVSQPNLGSNGGIVNIPTLPAGSYAIALDDGNEVDTNSSGGSTGHSEVALINGSTHAVTHMSDPETPAGSGSAAHGFAIDNPWGLGWDAQNSQLVIANNATFHHLVSFYDTSGNFIKSVNTTKHNNLLAVSPDGHIAVARIATFLGYPEVQVYLNAAGAAAPSTVLAAIPFNGESSGCGGGGTHIYGSDTAVVQSLEWLSNTKLLIGLKSTSAGVYTAQNGLYIFDITASAVPTGTTDTGGCPAFASAAPKQTGFQHLNQRPFATAYKP